MEQSIEVRRQNYMWAVRRELGWPSFKPVNDSIAFAAGRPFNVELGMELARHAEAARKDFIYTGWASSTAIKPDGLVVIIREMLTVDIVSRAFLWAADETAPLSIVSTQDDEHFVIGSRGLLERRPGKPNGLARGKKIATRRVQRTAATMRNTLCPENFHIANGGAWSEPASLPQDTFVRFA